ncbi:Putative type II restriction enzyme NmeDIP (Endonuclease NmeDIP) (R.NmeDIP) [hydrothermal vent metagenome]|uniref:Type II restriction enzyme NmeDIP (Endonuclease NmeDIP) (R.NmeDIP) n=1 Tax=hydrothermal vent metagenome TaxID=652676 RepID=A0A3B1BFS5_9ZZZZ
MTGKLNEILDRYKSDEESVFNTWFINNDERLKAFRSIRRGVQNVIRDIKEKSFGNDYKGSSLEFILNCITEQKQVFIGASHAFTGSPNSEFQIFMKMKKISWRLVNFLRNVTLPRGKIR